MSHPPTDTALTIIRNYAIANVWISRRDFHAARAKMGLSADEMRRVIWQLQDEGKLTAIWRNTWMIIPEVMEVSDADRGATKHGLKMGQGRGDVRRYRTGMCSAAALLFRSGDTPHALEILTAADVEADDLSTMGLTAEEEKALRAALSSCAKIR